MIKSLQTPNGSVIFRESSLADAVQFRELRLDALQDSPTAFSADYQTNADHPISFWAGRVKPDPYGTIFFAEHDSKLIGMTGIRMGESPKTKHGGYIWGVYIRAEWRGLRIAEELIKICIEWAKGQDIELVKLGVVSSNTSAIRCYERCGFKVYGTEPHGILYDGKYYDEHLMWRSVKES
jgi:RimJ/RimL family protein N-acetyltransferase